MSLPTAGVAAPPDRATGGRTGCAVFYIGRATATATATPASAAAAVGGCGASQHTHAASGAGGVDPQPLIHALRGNKQRDEPKERTETRTEEGGKR